MTDSVGPRPVTARQISQFLGLELFGDDAAVTCVRSVAGIEPGSLVFAQRFGPAMVETMNATSGIVAIAAPEYEGKLSCAHMLCENPVLAFTRAVREFFVPKKAPCIASTAVVAKDAAIGRGVSIGEYSVIESGCVVGDGTEIRHHVVLASGTRVGNRCVIRSHCVVGEEGYGPATDNFNGPLELMPQLGCVILGDEVELGTFCTVNRATLDRTVIGDRTKIGHHVNIGHNVTVGQDVFISSCSELSGSVVVENGVWVAPCVSVREGLVIGERSMVGIGANVTKSVEPGKVVVGNPAHTLADRKSRI